MAEFSFGLLPDIKFELLPDPFVIPDLLAVSWNSFGTEVTIARSFECFALILFMYMEDITRLHPVLGDDVARVARDIHAFEIRIKSQKLLCQLRAVHPRHDYIGQQHLYFVSILLCYTEGIF